MQEEVNRIAGKTVEPILAGDIRYKGIDGIRGVYHQVPGGISKILVAALDLDKIGILRHELIHHLYRNGFFKPEEWNALIEASKKEGWIERYGIADRYDHLNELVSMKKLSPKPFAIGPRPVSSSRSPRLRRSSRSSGI